MEIIFIQVWWTRNYGPVLSCHHCDGSTEYCGGHHLGKIYHYLVSLTHNISFLAQSLNQFVMVKQLNRQ